jgi:hypothetical protein
MLSDMTNKIRKVVQDGYTIPNNLLVLNETESEFPDVYLDFIRQHGLPYALPRDNTESETSKSV